MKKNNQLHDKFVKEMLGEKHLAKDFIKHYLPSEILGIIKLDTLTAQKEGFITEDLQEFFSDLLFRVEMNEKEAFIYFLFEHKSYQDKYIILQLLRYMLEIWEMKKGKGGTRSIPVIIPIVIYHGKYQWKIPKELCSLMEDLTLTPILNKYIPNFEYLLYDFSSKHTLEIKGIIELQIFLELLRQIFANDIEHIIMVIEKAVSEELSEAYFKTMITYILGARNDVPIEDVKVRLTKERRKQFMSVAEQLREEGRLEGIQKGIQKGIQEGQKKSKLEMAKRMLQMEMEEERIMEITDVSANQLNQLKEEIKK